MIIDGHMDGWWIEGQADIRTDGHSSPNFDLGRWHPWPFRLLCWNLFHGRMHVLIGIEQYKITKISNSLYNNICRPSKWKIKKLWWGVMFYFMQLTFRLSEKQVILRIFYIVINIFAVGFGQTNFIQHYLNVIRTFSERLWNEKDEQN